MVGKTQLKYESGSKSIHYFFTGRHEGVSNDEEHVSSLDFMQVPEILGFLVHIRKYRISHYKKVCLGCLFQKATKTSFLFKGLQNSFPAFATLTWVVVWLRTAQWSSVWKQWKPQVDWACNSSQSTWNYRLDSWKWNLSCPAKLLTACHIWEFLEELN